MKDQWVRVTRKQPCPICEKPDWCLLARDGTAAICARVGEGVVKRAGEGGWLHHLNGREPPKYQPPLRSAVNSRHLAVLAVDFATRITQGQVDTLAGRLGVSPLALVGLGLGWDGAAWTIPMFNHVRNVIGVHRRFPDGRKRAIRGSKNGLFIPVNLASEGLLLICEGASDTAALLTLGFAAIGRPGCLGGARIIRALAKRRRVVIVADQDGPGQDGAERLAAALRGVCSTVAVITPPPDIKDSRAWVQAGATHGDIQAVIDRTPSHSRRPARAAAMT